jgi:hypothetical protein
MAFRADETDCRVPLRIPWNACCGAQRTAASPQGSAGRWQARVRPRPMMQSRVCRLVIPDVVRAIVVLPAAAMHYRSPTRTVRPLRRSAHAALDILDQAGDGLGLGSAMRTTNEAGSGRRDSTWLHDTGGQPKVDLPRLTWPKIASKVPS